MGKDFYLGQSRTKLKKKCNFKLLSSKALCCNSSAQELLQYAGILQNVVHRCKGF